MTQQTVTTTGDGTFTVPANTFSLTIEAWGAGGGGTAAFVAGGGGGGGYSLAVVTVSPGQSVFFHVGAGGGGARAPSSASSGEDSWVNPSANSPPVSGGVIGGGGGGALNGGGGVGVAGIGSIGTTNFNGGAGGAGSGGDSTGGGGGGGAGSAGAGSDGTVGGPGGAGGSPDGGKGADGVGNGPAAVGTQPGGGGAGEWNNVTGGSNGGAGQVRFTWTAIVPAVSFDPTTLTNKPAKAFTRKHYYNELEKIRGEKQAERDELDGLDERDIADRDYEAAKTESDEYENNLGVRNYAKAMDAKERLAKARKARDHHYFMDVVKKAWADHEASKKK